MDKMQTEQNAKAQEVKKVTCFHGVAEFTSRVDGDKKEPEMEKKENRTIYIPDVLEKLSDISACFYETADGQHMLRLQENLPIFDSSDREFDSWHALYLFHGNGNGVVDGVFARGGYVVAFSENFYGLKKVPPVVWTLLYLSDVLSREEWEQLPADSVLPLSDEKLGKLWKNREDLKAARNQ